MPNWKLSLAGLLIFTFVGLPTLGQHLETNTFQRLDVISWSAEILEPDESSNPPVLERGLRYLAKENKSHQAAADHLNENQIIKFLRNTFSSAMSF